MKLRLFGVLLFAGALAFFTACGDDNNSLAGVPFPTNTAAPAPSTPTFTQTPLGTPTGTAAPTFTQTPLGTPTGTAGQEIAGF
jgi:hypothetical protein